MVFNSFDFLYFFIIVCLIMSLTNMKYICKTLQQKKIYQFRHIILLIASYIFYAFWNIKCCLLMLLLSIIAYGMSILYVKTKKKIYIIAGVVFLLIILAIFKYFNFFIGSFCYVWGIKNPHMLNIILPMGISFYTFQALSYLIDVYKNKIEVEKSFLKVSLFISFFPQLVAGPIVKANKFMHQLYEDRNINIENVRVGIQQFLFGLFKKVVVADNISLGVDSVWQSPLEYHAISVLLCIIGYSIQIYCDFSGYSDMAIGCAKCLGYDLPCNFNMPYISKNVQEFWKRWHISLSTWLKDYLYIPLGGNRKGKVRTYINLMCTMLLGGLWHGAAWTFVLWGFLHGLALCIHRFYKNVLKYQFDSKIYKFMSAVLTYVFVCFCWVFFRSPDMKTSKDIICQVAGWKNGVVFINTWIIFGIVLVFISTLVAYWNSKKKKMQEVTGFYPVLSLDSIWSLTIFFIAICMTLGLAYTGNNPFIYFQF